MKKIITLIIYLILGQYCFGQYQIQIPSAPYKPGDTVNIQITYFGSENNPLVPIHINSEQLNSKFIYDFKPNLKDIPFYDHAYHFKFAIPDSLTTGSYHVNVGGATGTFYIETNTSGVLNPFLPENKDREFDFYNQSGLFIVRSKLADLSTGFYISNGFKISKD